MVQIPVKGCQFVTFSYSASPLSDQMMRAGGGGQNQCENIKDKGWFRSGLRQLSQDAKPFS